MDATVEADDRGLLVTCPQCGKRNRMSYERLAQTFRCGQCHQALPAPSHSVEIKSEAAFAAMTTHSALPVAVDFWAEWCGPCKMMGPEFEKVAAEMTHSSVLAKLNTEEVPVVAQRFGISAIPTLVLFKAGREVSRQAGAMPAATIRRFIEQAG